MSTRKLIIAALLCGLAILLAFTVQLFMISNGGTSHPPTTAVSYGPPVPVRSSAPAGP
jgi:hypothetical protein